MVGNLSEYVDYRLKPISVTRFGSTQTVGTIVRNGIDNLTMQWPQATPGTSNLALTMGSFHNSKNYANSGNAQLGLFDASSAAWDGIGFRCMGVRADTVPSLAEMALVDQPKYTPADMIEAPSTRHVPENNFVGDDKPERLTVSIGGNTTDNIAEGSISLSWVPWSKTVCDVSGSCTSSNSGLTYKLYRFISPNFFSQKEGIMRWAMGISGSSYTTETLIDPLGIDTSWNPSFTSASSGGKIVATITNCDNVTPGNCSFTDSTAASNGFSANTIYEYVLVVGSASQNYRYADVQRFRSAFLIGGFAANFSQGASRLEPRFRKAAVFPFDKAYQEAQTIPQVMVLVPMDVSGLDRDVFMQKYEGSRYSGNYSTGGGGAPGLPNSPTTCVDLINRTNTFPVVGCGVSTYTNVTGTIIQSRLNRTPAISHDRGDAFKACWNSALVDGAGLSYRLHLPTLAEWFKAADWGDVDLDGTIDQNAFTGGTTSINTLQASSPADTSSIRCHVDASPASAYNSGDANTANCVSRYGAENMIGNVAEWTMERSQNKIAQDNGYDGFNYNQTFFPTSGSVTTLTYNLLSALPRAGTATVYSDFDAYTTPPDNAQRYVSAGGSWDPATYGAAGRFN
ncbi:MAG: hypothetical protein EOP14_05685, partial [Pseudomonas sp.]